MRLLPRQTCSSSVWERASRLGAELPFRRAARVLSDLLGAAVDHRVAWRLVQRAGALRRAEQERARAEMFEQGLARGWSPVVAGLWEEGAAGQVIYAWLCRSVGVHRARYRMVSGDGAEPIPVLVRHWFPDAVFQLDHYHLKVRLRRTAGDPERASRWIARALQGRWRSLERSMLHLVARGTLDPEVARETRSFLALGAPAIWAHRQLRRQGAPPELCTRGSGVVEHAVDLVVARRMKRQGMFWSREGANNMLALRALLADPRSWRAWWEEVSA